MVALYGIPRQQLVPDRPATAAQDTRSGTITIGSVTFTLHAADDDSLRAFLTAVRTQRGLAASAGLAVRASDATLLAELLGGAPEQIVASLQRLLGLNEAEAVELGRWMFRRTTIAGALAIGLMAGVTGIGPLSSDLPRAAAGEISTKAGAAPVDPDWAVIGDAAVLERDTLPGGG
jgi:hypothetical protein